jgi:hypothetical protein
MLPMGLNCIQIKRWDDLKVEELVVVEQVATKPHEGEMSSQVRTHKSYCLQLNFCVIEIINCEMLKSIHLLFICISKSNHFVPWFICNCCYTKNKWAIRIVVTGHNRVICFWFHCSVALYSLQYSVFYYNQVYTSIHLWWLLLLNYCFFMTGLLVW